MKVESERKYMEMVTDMMTKFRSLIVEPLETEVKNLRNEVNELRDAVQKINDCPFSGDCPVRKRMQHDEDFDEV